jgi:selenocysteine lyase/cysteine desulfurase
MLTLDLEWIRAQFPALTQEVNGRPAIFFDGPGGTQVPQRVIDTIGDYLARSNANTHGAFATSASTDATIAAAHAAMADLLGCHPDEVVFGANMTSLTFMLSRSIGREIWPGDEIVLTRLDHDANFSPWKALEERGAVIKVVDIDVEECTLDMADMARQITDRTKLVAAGYASNLDCTTDSKIRSCITPKFTPIAVYSTRHHSHYLSSLSDSGHTYNAQYLE